jgi:hypothetical protein
MADKRWFMVTIIGDISDEQYAHLAHQSVVAALAAGIDLREIHLRGDGEQSKDELSAYWEELGRESPWE